MAGWGDAITPYGYDAFGARCCPQLLNMLNARSG
jgi:hypothetical protein